MPPHYFKSMFYIVILSLAALWEILTVFLHHCGNLLCFTTVKPVKLRQSLDKHKKKQRQCNRGRRKGGKEIKRDGKASNQFSTTDSAAAGFSCTRPEQALSSQRKAKSSTQHGLISLTPTLLLSYTHTYPCISLALSSLRRILMRMHLQTHTHTVQCVFTLCGSTSQSSRQYVKHMCVCVYVKFDAQHGKHFFSSILSHQIQKRGTSMRRVQKDTSAFGLSGSRERKKCGNKESQCELNRSGVAKKITTGYATPLYIIIGVRCICHYSQLFPYWYLNSTLCLYLLPLHQFLIYTVKSEIGESGKFQLSIMKVEVEWVA